MNYYQPRERPKEPGVWDFTKRNDNFIIPVGFCLGGQGGCDGKGHASRAEAAECYRQYRLKRFLILNAGKLQRERKQCDHEGCEIFTDIVTDCDGKLFFFCEAHRRQEEVEKLFKVSDFIVSSY